MITEISTTKANHLYWMGRYAERVYLALHLLRKHYDKMIDDDSDAYVKFCQKMGVSYNFTSAEEFIRSYLYDKTNPDSIISMLERVNDNAILLRDEIRSETLSYIQLCTSHMAFASEQTMILSGLQNITDYILAFWGSVDERISNPNVRKTIKFGKFVESADLHIRFEYSFDRIDDINQRLFETICNKNKLCNDVNLKEYKSQMTPEKYLEHKTLFSLNKLFSAE